MALRPPMGPRCRTHGARARRAPRRGASAESSSPHHQCRGVGGTLDRSSSMPSGRPSVVAGVPPDFFFLSAPPASAVATRLYRWPAHAHERLCLVDGSSCDAAHLSSGSTSWRLSTTSAASGPLGDPRSPPPPLPRRAPDAQNGRWVPVPAAGALRTRSSARSASWPIIAEDLGVITPAVGRAAPTLRLSRHAHPAVRIRRTDSSNHFLRTTMRTTAWSTPARTTRHDTRLVGAGDSERASHAGAYLGHRSDARFHWDLIRAVLRLRRRPGGAPDAGRATGSAEKHRMKPSGQGRSCWDPGIVAASAGNRSARARPTGPAHALVSRCTAATGPAEERAGRMKNAPR
jgi:hypothetical protein